MMELTQGGKNPLALPGGETRAFLRGRRRGDRARRCARDGYATIGFGEASGTIRK